VNEAPRYVTVRDYLRVAREHGALILVLTLLFGAGAYVYSSRQKPVYKAEAAIEFQSQGTESSLLGQPIDVGGQTPEARAAAAASTLVRPSVLRRAKKALDFAGPADFIGGLVSVRPEARTNLVIVTAGARTGPLAADVANAVARAAVDVARDSARRVFARAAAAQRSVLRRLPRGPASGFSRAVTLQSLGRLDELSRVATPAVLRRRAEPPGSKSSPHTVRTALLGLLVGLTLGLVAAFMRDSLDGRLRSSGELTSDLGLRVLGHVREDMLGSGFVEAKRRLGRRRRPPLSEPDLEQFRILRANLDYLGETVPKLLLITSAAPGEGKSTVATSLAAAYALAGKRTLIVEGDLRRPTLAARLGVAASPGLADYLSGRAEPDDILRSGALPPAAEGNGVAAQAPGAVVAIVAGSPTRQPAEVLRTDACHGFFAEVREAYDVVVVDTCPLLSVADALELVPLADAVLLCVRGSKTTRSQVEAAKSLLSRLPDRPLGVVVTGMRTDDEQSRYGYYAYEAKAGARAA
jgi:polysaccharide biosynthesis transport protein